MTILHALVAISAFAAAPLNDQLQTFPIGFWNYAPISVFDEAKIQEWQDAGITLTMGPNFSATPEGVDHMKKILDWAHARDIKLIICDPRTHPGDPDTAKARAEAAVADFGSHPATFGFHVLDEPDKDQFEPTYRQVRALKEAAPNLFPFVNLLPWHEGVNERVGCDDWATYLDNFLTKSGADFLCYDCYSQMNEGKSGWPMYFKNLREYRAAAKKRGLPFWNTILSVGHFHYRCPSEDDIRWQFNTSVAYGAQGILYFFFYMRQPHDNYRLAPIDEFWERTAGFDSLRRTNKGFIKRYGRLFLDLDLQKAMQYPEPVEGCAPFEPDDLIKEVKADKNGALILSRFTDKQGRPWLAVVNNSTEQSTHATVVLNGAETKLYKMDWNAQEVGAENEHVEGGVKFSHWLAPGQMEVYRIEPASKAE